MKQLKIGHPTHSETASPLPRTHPGRTRRERGELHDSVFPSTPGAPSFAFAGKGRFLSKLTRNCFRREEFNAKRNSRVYGSKLRSAKPTSSNESMTFSNPVICSTCRK